ncbi:MAG: hypothetical protein HYZ58_16005 [Acidobacteria bacterium]|nr:hypothetical protein [Acidobacteriota bacterium]MBI3264629.1 hypothetical protein [Acidobacteriota bacterium]
MSSTSDVPPDLQALENEMRRLEIEYNMFFAGARLKPPSDQRARVEAIVRRYDRAPMTNTADRFRFSTLQQRFAAFADLWDRAMKAREEGRPTPFAAVGGAPLGRAAEHPRAPEAGSSAREQVLHVTMISDPVSEIDKVQRLYETLVRTRQDLGERTVPFHRFADMIRRQVAELHASGSGEVAFRASLKDGKVRLTARARREVRSEK